MELIGETQVVETDMHLAVSDSLIFVIILFANSHNRRSF